MSELAVGSLAGLAANSYVIDVASGSQLTQPGMVLQVVSTTKTDTFSASLSGNAFSSNVTGLEATITPSSATSKIFVFVSVTASRTTEIAQVAFRILRDSTPIAVGATSGSKSSVSASGVGLGGANSTLTTVSQTLDTPSSTSAITYGVQMWNQSATTQTTFVNRSSNESDAADYPRATSTITVMEIAG